MKKFGDTKTNLTLTERAFEVYSNTSPLDICEMPDGTYKMTGAIERENMSEADVNEVLEDLGECWDEE